MTVSNPNVKGNITALEILTYVTKLGYTVSLPFDDKARYDQIWDINGKLLRIQVKTARLNTHEKDRNNESIQFNCCTIVNGVRRKYTKFEIDYFATYWKGKVYVVPVTNCTVKTLRFSSTQPKQPNVAWAEDYVLETVLNNMG